MIQHMHLPIMAILVLVPPPLPAAANLSNSGSVKQLNPGILHIAPTVQIRH
jgi:hypothetical protein